jgi:hypothetical protein
VTTKKLIIYAAVIVGGYLLYTRVIAKPAVAKTAA